MEFIEAVDTVKKRHEMVENRRKMKSEIGLRKKKYVKETYPKVF